MLVIGRPNDSIEVLRNDVGQECRFSRSGHSQYNSLHHSNLVGPEPRLPMDVVAEDNRVLAPSLARNPFVFFGRHSKRRMRPLLFAARSRRPQAVYGATDGSQSDYEIPPKFQKLPVREEDPFLWTVHSEPGDSTD